METLQTTIEKHTGKQSFALLKHLSDCFGEVPEWGGAFKNPPERVQGVPA